MRQEARGKKKMAEGVVGKVVQGYRGPDVPGSTVKWGNKKFARQKKGEYYDYCGWNLIL
jgi:hypothetical protein